MIRYIDLFAGVGGFRYAMQRAAAEFGLAAECVFSSEIDKECQRVYQANFGELPQGDITAIPAASIPEHDILLAGFPCQPFSIIGQRKGFQDARGTLFFEIARILDAKKPSVFVLENVKLLAGHNKGETLRTILEILRELGYNAGYKILNALDFGLPQKRERIFLVGFRKPCLFQWPAAKMHMRPLKDILEHEVAEEYFASEHIRKKRLSRKQPSAEPTIWHENKSGNISAYPFSCALRAGASYNYLLVNGERRLTAREMFRLQGFPEDFKIISSYAQARKQAGNSLPVPVAKAVIRNVLEAYGLVPLNSQETAVRQLNLFTAERKYNEIAKAADGGKISAAVSA
ncbi:DNA (cytosine-5-)-methyltransferase [Candidatus Electronema sp. PJ]|uniref:DNA (cytosine-5-)-methyltransferase n=1 Tax=Candidatus Electronema sp. PJ TaxID=3401572 RepID=UPI003AA8C9FB